MTAEDWLGSIGVAILLAAFYLNLSGRLAVASRLYQGLNALGALLAAAAALAIPFYPFVVLEGTWALVALLALGRSPTNSPGKT